MRYRLLVAPVLFFALVATAPSHAAESGAQIVDAAWTSVAWGRFSLTLVPKAGGDPVVMTGRFTEAAERRAGTWVYIVDHASAEPAPSGK